MQYIRVCYPSVVGILCMCSMSYILCIGQGDIKFTEIRASAIILNNVDIILWVGWDGRGVEMNCY